MAKSWQIGLVQWGSSTGITNAIRSELVQMGHCSQFVEPNGAIAGNVDIVLSDGPHGRYRKLYERNGALFVGNRPLHVHWSTEGLPDLRLPWRLMKGLSLLRSRADRFVMLQRWMMRYRYLGDNLRSYSEQALSLLADVSAIYADFQSANGLPTLHVPFGSHRDWYADLDLERDIDVLWLGKRATRRRGRILDSVRAALEQVGVEVTMVDGVERPFVFGAERTKLLNRAKITLNVTRTWYDDNTMRFTLAMPNRSLIVSEPILAHCPAYRPGVHYVSAAPDRLADTIVDYLRDDRRRQAIIEQAYRLSTSQLTLRRSLTLLLAQAEAAMQALPLS